MGFLHLVQGIIMLIVSNDSSLTITRNYLEFNQEIMRLVPVSSPGGFHPQALSEPDLNLSIHPAPIIQPYRISPLSSVQIDEAPCEQELLAIYPLLYDLSFSCTCFLPTELRLCLADSVLYTSQICESVHSSLSNLYPCKKLCSLLKFC